MLEKWSLNRLSHETGMDRRTVKKHLEKAEPCDFNGEDPLYRLADLIAALREREKSDKADYEAEKTRLTKAQADQAELDLSVSRKEVVPVAIAFQCVSNMLFAVRRIIEMSELPNDRKDAIFNELQSMKPDDFITEAKFEENAQ
jgi:phage terminase Nu1 subunit (DNA packaging protein)